MIKSAENDRFKLVVKRIGCYEKLLREMLQRKVTKETIEAHGKFDELKATVDNQKARTFFILEEQDNYQESRLAMYIEQYLRHFLLSGGEDPYPNVEYSEVIREKNESKYNDSVGVVLTEEKMKGKKVCEWLQHL